jgi:C-terminal processing protease CtpA/Prc
LLYTNPMRAVGCDFLASEENAAFYRGHLQDAQLPLETRHWIADLVTRMEGSPGSFVTGGPDQEIRFESPLERPGRIGILIDGTCASATEGFLLLACQSRKVTLFGSRTKGCLDYSNLRPVALPSGRSILHVPTSRSRRLPGAPIDATGVVPDIPVPVDAADPIAFVLEHLRSSRGSWDHADRRGCA